VKTRRASGPCSPSTRSSASRNDTTWQLGLLELDRRGGCLARTGGQRGTTSGPRRSTAAIRLQAPPDRRRARAPTRGHVDRRPSRDVVQLLPLRTGSTHSPTTRSTASQPRALFANRGYDFDKYRRALRERGITPRIARRGVPHGSGLGKIRWVVDRGFAWLHAFKRLRTRYDGIHLGLLQLACA
jgi:transposase